MIYEAHLRAGWAELLREFLRSALLMPHARVVFGRIQKVRIRNRPLPCRVQLQIMAIQRPRLLPPEAHLMDLLWFRSEEHTSELQSRFDLVCRLLLEKKKTITHQLNL